MITIKESGKIFIPQEDGFIGYAGDNLNKTIEFMVLNRADENLYYRVYLEFDDETVNFFILNKEIQDCDTLLTWTVTADQIFKDGIVNMQIKAFNTSGEVFHTESVPLFVGKSIEFCNYIADKSVSEFLEMEQNLNKLFSDVENAKKFLPYIGTNGNWFTYDYDAKKFIDTGVAAKGTAVEYPLVTAVSSSSDNNHVPSAKAVWDFGDDIAQESRQSIEDLNTKTGGLSYLNTNDKTSIVNAVNEINTSKLSDAAETVDTDNIANGAVTEAKLETSIVEKINNSLQAGYTYAKSEIAALFTRNGYSAIYDIDGKLLKATVNLYAASLANDNAVTAFIGSYIKAISSPIFANGINLKTIFINNAADDITIDEQYIPTNAKIVYLGTDNSIRQDLKAIAQKADSVKIVEETSTAVSIQPNKFYSFGEAADLNITLAAPSDKTILNEYMFEFASGATAATLTLPDSVKWLETPTIKANRLYQCSIVNNVGVLLGVSNE